MEYTIPIYGIIGSPESNKDKALHFTFNDFLAHMSRAKDAEIINLDINSIGGYCDVADKMISMLIDSGKQLSSFNSGDVCSAASKLFTIPSRDMRVFYPQKGKFLIHNPWSMTEGDADAHIEMAISLKETEIAYEQWYSNQTGTDENIINGLMSEDVPLSPEQIEQFNFATVIDIKIEAFAKLSNKNQTNNKKDMNENTKVLEKINVLEKLIKAVTDKFTKALMVNDTSGNELNFPEISDISEIVEGTVVTIGGESLTGDYILSNDNTIKVVDGKVTEVIPPVEEEAPAEEEVPVPAEEEVPVEESASEKALKLQIAELQAKLEAETNAKSLALEAHENISAQLVEVSKEIKAIKALSSNHIPDSNSPEPTHVDNKAKGFSYKKK